jgi:hypothetical protein
MSASIFLMVLRCGLQQEAIYQMDAKSTWLAIKALLAKERCIVAQYESFFLRVCKTALNISSWGGHLVCILDKYM